MSEQKTASISDVAWLDAAGDAWTPHLTELWSGIVWADSPELALAVLEKKHGPLRPLVLADDLDSIVRREVAKALREVADQTPSVRITRSGGTATCTVSLGGKPLFIGSAPATEAVIATTDSDNGEWGQP